MSLDDNLDSFLDAIDEDPDWSSDDDDPISTRIDKETEREKLSSTSLSSSRPNEKGKDSDAKTKDSLTFNDIFGSPIKKKSSQSINTNPNKKNDTDEDHYTKIMNGVSSVASSSSSSTISQQQMKNHTSSFSSTNKSTADTSLKKLTTTSWTKQPQQQQQQYQNHSKSYEEKNSNKPYVLSTNKGTSETVIDPFSRISLFKTSVNLMCDDGGQNIESVMKERNIGQPYVNLISFPYWHKTTGKDVKKFWTTAVLTKKSGKRTSAAGNEYSLWEMNDLKDLEQNWTLFLFGSASSAPSLNDIPVGSVIDLISPSVMENSGGNSGPLKFSVSNLNQVRHIGTARYFGYCPAKRKDGKNCTGVVNTSECNVCIYHVGKELKKTKGKEKALLNARNGFGSQKVVHIGGSGGGGSSRGPTTKKFPNESFDSPTQAGIKVVNYNSKSTAGTKAPARMELQGGMSSMQRTRIRHGNHSSISFEQDKNKYEGLPKLQKKEVKEPLKIDPNRSRHLTDKDRQILEALGAKNTNSDLPEILAKNPNAGAKNYLQYLAQEQHKLDMSRQDKNPDEAGSDVKGYGQSVSMNRAVLKSMKEALSFVRKNGPITKIDPNDPSGKKRKLSNPTSSSSSSSNFTTSNGNSKDGSSTSSSSSSSNTNGNVRVEKNKKAKTSNIEIEFDFESDEFKSILNAKSKHEKLLEEVQHEEYFSVLEKKEVLENKLLNTFTIPTSAVMCRDCKYVACSQSDYCKEKRHVIRVVKATKRFFKCRDCGNRAMSLDRLPKQPCSNCKSTSWLVTSVGKERKGPVLESEILCIRGDEEKFMGQTSGQMFLNLSS